MRKYNFSLRTSLVLTVLAMGLLGMVLAVITGEVYRELAFQNQSRSFANLVDLKTQDLLEKTIKNTSELGLTVQSNTHFRRALSSKNLTDIQKTLNEQFHRFFVTMDILKLEKLYTFDTEFNLIGYSTEGSTRLNTGQIPCPTIINRVKTRIGASRLKTYSEMCLTNDMPYLGVIVPIGGIRLKGYLLVAIDPTRNLIETEKALGTPLTLSSIDGRTLYESENWPSKDAKNILLSNYVLHNKRNRPIYNFTFATDVANLHDQLATTRAIIIISASLITLLTVVFSLLLLQKTAINPLAKLTQQLRRVKEDRSYLGKEVAVSGNSEVIELAEDFNNMTGELNVLYKTLEAMAFTDSLTGLPNRAQFYDRLEQATQLSSRDNKPFMLMVLDLDRFKFVNDTLGHHIGDQLLQVIAARLQTVIGEDDAIARLGGDEFAAILSAPHNLEAPQDVAKNILHAMSEPVIIGNHRLNVGTSIGIAYCPQDGHDSNQLMQRADLAMYHAKKSHEGYTLYESHLDKHSLIQLNLESELKHAIENNQLELHYQPKINLSSHCTTGVECLVRWIHPTRGFMPPDEFIPLSEQTGLINPLTRWVLETALLQCARWHKAGKLISVAVNISARSLETTELLDIVSAALVKTGIAPHWLVLELTESAVMTNPDRAMDMLTKLHYTGVRISVDDFGTGYSSLAYLKKLPVSDIKIDKSFVMEMDSDGSDAVIVRSTIDLAHNMGLDVIAEGVENEEVWNMLVNLGCDHAQGYFMCKPCKADDINEWLEESDWGYKKMIKVISRNAE